MPDKLTEWFNSKVKDDMTPMQVFQAGVTASAVSMRDRAMKAVSDIQNKPSVQAQGLLNEVKNAIGSLPDIPQ